MCEGTDGEGCEVCEGCEDCKVCEGAEGSEVCEGCEGAEVCPDALMSTRIATGLLASTATPSRHLERL